MDRPDAIGHRLTLWVVLAALAFSSWPCHGLPSRRDRWATVRTEHFILLGNAPRATILAVGRDLEQLRAVLSQISDLRLDPTTPTILYVFKNEKHLQPYAHLQPDGRPRRLSGAFFRNPHVNHILINGEHPQRARRVVFHEYVHFFISYNLPAVPLWFEEGLAELYSTFEADAEQAHLGKAVPHHLQWLRTREWIPLADLLTVDRASPIYNEQSRQGSYYAQSWLLAHYLLHGRSDDGAALSRLLASLSSWPPEQALQLSLDMSAAELDQTLRRYAAQDVHVSRRIPLQQPPTSSGSTWRRLPRLDTLVALGHLLAVQTGRRFEAEQHFRAALDIDSRQVEAWVGLGLAAERADDFNAAVDAYGHALSLNPSHDLAASLSARARLARGEDPRLVRLELRRITQRRPESALAWQLLAATYGHPQATPQEAREGIPVFLRALELSPEHHRLARALHRLFQWLHMDQEASRLEAEYFRPRGLSPKP